MVGQTPDDDRGLLMEGIGHNDPANLESDSWKINSGTADEPRPHPFDDLLGLDEGCSTRQRRWRRQLNGSDG
jgi:hypothetical protein